MNMGRGLGIPSVSHGISISADTMFGARGACCCWVGMKVAALLVVLSVSLAGRGVGCLVTVT